MEIQEIVNTDDQQTEVANQTVQPFNLEVGDVNVTIMSQHGWVDMNAGLTKIKINYPKKYEPQKFFSDGDIKFVHADMAKQFVKQGIATIIE